MRPESGGLAAFARAVWLVGAWLAGSAVAQGQPAVVTISTAQARFEPDGLAPIDRQADLVHRWDVEFPGRDGRAIYHVELPAHPGDEPTGVLFSRVGNQVRVRLNGTTVQTWGVLGDPSYDAAKTVRMAVLPAGLLRADRVNDLSVEVTIQQQRWGGLSVLRYGPQGAIEAMYEDQHRWRHSALVVFAVSLIGMGGLAGALWWRQREPLYGWFSLAAFLGFIRDIDRVWPDVPVPWPLWGAIEAACYASHLALICRFTLMALGPTAPWIGRAISVVVLLVSTLAVGAFFLHRPVLWTVGLGTLVPLGVASLGLVVREALRSGEATAWVLAGAGALAVAAGIHDFSLIRLGNSSGLRNQLTPPAMFAFVVVMGGLVAERYNRSVADYRALNADLSRRVADRELQLQQAFDALREQAHRQSIATERQRIMREIHDGVGSQLVGLLNMVTQPGADPAALQEQVQLALDEMRMAVDSLQPVHDDLVTVLATLRYRLQPRLQAAGVEVLWDMAELPALPMLLPQAVLQVQRILLEAFTNVLKHARATQVRVRVRWHADEATVRLEIADNGVGLGADGAAGEAQRHGYGISNMRARATAIGAVLRVEARADRGVAVVLEWPVPAVPAVSR